MAASRKDHDWDFIYKLVIIGDPGVGKSSILLQFADGVFSKEIGTTLGVDFRNKSIDIDGKTVKLQIWDTAGQDRFNKIAKAYYRSADGVIMVFDVTRRETYDHVKFWAGEVAANNTRNPARLLVGNKIDSKSRVVTTAEGEALAAELGLRYLETSAKTADNVNTAFDLMARALMTSGTGTKVEPPLPAPAPSAPCSC